MAEDRISWPTVYDKIDFLQAQCLKFLGDREAQISRRPHDELLLETDRQAYLCNWNQAADARNVQITGVATAEKDSGYVLAMNVAYDPEPNFAEVEAEAIRSGDYEKPIELRKYARLWLYRDFAESSDRAAEVRDKRRRRKAEGDVFDWEQDTDLDDEDDEDLRVWTRRLPDVGMLVHDDYTLHAHCRLLRQLVKKTTNCYRQAEWAGEHVAR